MGEIMKDAAFTYAEARYAAGEFSHMVLQNVSKAQVKIKSRKDNVAGKRVESLFLIILCVRTLNYSC